MQDNDKAGGQGKFALVSIRLPVALTFAALVGGLIAGIAGAALGAPAVINDITALVGGLWLRALQMTIIPLVAALLVLGLVQMIGAARVGTVARRMLLVMVAVQLAGGAFTSIAMPPLLKAFPVPQGASAFLAQGTGDLGEVPGVLDFFSSLVSPNIIAAAAETAMLPLTIFFVMFAVAITRLPEDQSERLLGFFHALGNVMLLIIGWVLAIAPVGVFALAYGVGVQSGGGAFAALGHYVLAVTLMGTFVFLLAYFIAAAMGRTGLLTFTKAVLPAQAVALSTQSSLASLPAMLDSAGRLGLRASTSEFVLPLAVVIFRATCGDEPCGGLLHCSARRGGGAARHRDCGHFHRQRDQPQRRQPARIDQLRRLDRADCACDGCADRAAGIACRRRDAARSDAHLGQCHHERRRHKRG